MAPHDFHNLPLTLDDVHDLPTPNHAPAYVFLSIASFFLTKSILSSSAPPEAKCQGPVTVWKWVNTANSLLHSMVTGIGAAICVYLYPSVAVNVIATYSDYSHRLVCYSVGYFLFDFADMLLNHRKRSSYELMIHHVFVLSCFILSVATRYYLAFTIISLVVENNSIFLHWRQLLLITRVPKWSSYYRTVSGANLLTFVLFRIVTLGWMTRWLAINSRLVPPAPYALGCVSVGALMLMSIVLFFRLLSADFQEKRRMSSSSNNNGNKTMTSTTTTTDGMIGGGPPPVPQSQYYPSSNSNSSSNNNTNHHHHCRNMSNGSLQNHLNNNDTRFSNGNNNANHNISNYNNKKGGGKGCSISSSDDNHNKNNTGISSSSTATKRKAQ